MLLKDFWLNKICYNYSSAVLDSLKISLSDSALVYGQSYILHLLEHRSECLFLCVCAARTLIHGDKRAGFTVFWADDGLDTGPILLQKACEVEPNDTVDTLYNRFLFPEGIKAMVTTQNSICFIYSVVEASCSTSDWDITLFIACAGRSSAAHRWWKGGSNSPVGGRSQLWRHSEEVQRQGDFSLLTAVLHLMLWSPVIWLLDEYTPIW